MISLNNGSTFKEFGELNSEDLNYIQSHWTALTMLMDDEVREQVHSRFSECDNLTFLKEYLKTTTSNLILG